ncbi:hypothetical protein LXA43DRAFT_1059932 [Ganoderma leucocontextum]|nr:hypothetical protein LXA43DRAFT_1059932 [Ganoderma leucocontextum]
MSSSPLNVSSVSAPVLRASMAGLLQCLVSLNPPEYHQLLRQIQHNQPLSNSIDAARQADIALRLCKKAIDTISIAKEDLQECKFRLGNTLKAIVDVLHQSPLGSQIPGEFYERYGYLPPIAHTSEEPEHEESEHEDPPPNSPTHSLDLPPWRRRSPRRSTQEATAQSEASTSRSSSRRASRQSTQSTPPRPTLQQRISSPTRSYHSGESDFSDAPFDHHRHSMEATFGRDEDGEVIYA